MNKKYLSVILSGILIAGSGGSFVSCTDYDDEIANLQQQIDATNVTLQQLQDLVAQGAIIQSVTTVTDGILITMHDGRTYTITNGRDGADGAQGPQGPQGEQGIPGKDAVTWTIGEDGYWYWTA